ncbi:sporulation integral membrane protein YtvI [Virgibacillus natechei]|uniref:Sporulation integral membrane protein YtvI n=1 Tax=Virgibacillus natechei TaxID=1216297 RepID=A0ABS4IFR2_9BACI|nr:sporulation integral membrane protein YtvI [Virgibacillus natechei]MBP1968874.1 sporulation integral membrane protein YtvI [Virgibacillus natechei]UZD11669.1 sporulation integral membrane protein YtvI [Virgibacillus natechei]
MSKPLLFRFLRALLLISIIICSYLLIKYTFSLLYPIVLALLISYLINPFVNFFQHTIRFPRPFATASVIIGLFIFLLGSLFLIVTELIQGSAYLAEKLPAHFHAFITAVKEFIDTSILPLYHKLISYFHTLEPSQQLTINENIQQLANNIASTGADLLQRLLLNIPVVLSMLPNSVAVFTFIVLATFLFTNDWPRLENAIRKMIPSSLDTSTKQVLRYLKKAVLGFVKAQVILIAITAGIIFIGLTILQVEHALTITLIAAAADLLPYVGTGIIFIPWIIYLFITGDYGMTISLIILYMHIIIVRQVLEPKILSSSMGLSPIAVLIAVFIGLQLWGFLGLVIAPVLLVSLNAFHQAGITHRLWIFIKG